MAAETHATDLLSHINLESSLSNRGKLKSGCVTIFDELGVKLELCWDVRAERLNTPSRLTISRRVSHQTKKEMNE